MSFESLIHIFEHRVNLSASGVALRYREYDQWNDYTWRQWWDEAEYLAAGFVALGFEPESRVALLSTTRVEWVWCDMGMMMAGGVVVPIYPSHLPEYRARLMTHAECSTLIVETPEDLAVMLPLLDPEQIKAVMVLDSLVSIEDEQTGLTSTLSLEDVLSAAGEVWAARCMTLAQWRALGRQHLVQMLDAVTSRRRALTAESLASIVFTSGTTDDPKGVCLTHGHFVAQVHALRRVDLIRPDDANLLILPLAHVFARIVVYAAMHYGAKTIFAEQLSTMVRDAQQTQPTLIAGVPHIFEKIARGMQRHMSTLQPIKAKLYAQLYRRAFAQVDVSCGQKPRTLTANLIESMLHQKLKSLFGGQLRVLISGGASLSEDVARFFYACGMGIVEGYGLTETTAALTINSANAYRFGSVGKALPNVDLTIGYDGEVLARGPSVADWMLGVDQTLRSLTDDKGWFHTGDLGRFDADGYLWLTGRKKSVIVTSGGKNIHPAQIEQRLMNAPLIDHALVHGEGRPYLVALVTLDMEVVEGLMPHLASLSQQALCAHPEVRALVDAHMAHVNAQAASYEMIRKYDVLSVPWTTEGGLLTPTLKIKRKEVIRKHAEVLASMYDVSLHEVV